MQEKDIGKRRTKKELINFSNRVNTNLVVNSERKEEEYKKGKTVQGFPQFNGKKSCSGQNN